MIERSETVQQHTEWGVEKPDGQVVRVSETGPQGDHDAHQLADTWNNQLDRMGLGQHLGIRARVLRRMVTTTVVTTRTSDGWSRR